MPAVFPKWPPSPVMTTHLQIPCSTNTFLFSWENLASYPFFSTLWRADKVPHTPLRAPFKRSWQANELFLQRAIVLCWFDQVWRFSIAALLSAFGPSVFPHLLRRGLVLLDLCFPAKTWTSARSPNYISSGWLDVILLIETWVMGLSCAFFTKPFSPPCYCWYQHEICTNLLI